MPYTTTPGEFGYVKASASGEASAYPEVQSEVQSLRRPPVAVSFPGGGSRAFSCGVGVLRALRAETLLDKAPFFTSVSGGSWCALPWLYSPYDDDALLGQYAPPSACDLEGSGKMTDFPSAHKGKYEAATRVRRWVLWAFGALGVDDFFLDLANRVFAQSAAGDVAGSECWKEVVAARYITPAEIDWETALLGKPGAASPAIAPRRATMPAILVNATIQGPSDKGGQWATKKAIFPPLVITADAAGMYAEVQDVHYDFRESKDETIRLGGLITPSAALGGGDPTKPFTLADAMSASSIAYATAVNQYGDLGLLNIIRKFDKRQRLSDVKEFPVWGADDKTTVEARCFDLGDGGNDGDNAGMAAALQRGVKSIFVYVPTSYKLDTSVDFGDDPDKWGDANLEPYLAAYFGYAKHSRSQTNDWGWNLNRMHVFEKAAFKPLVKQLYDTATTTSSPAATVTTTTVANDALGVLGGKEIKVTVVYQYLNRKTSLWYTSLPDETKAFLEQSENKDFPCYAITEQTLSPAQSNLLANFAAWSCLQHKDLLTDAFVPP